MLIVRCGQGGHCSWVGELGQYHTHSTTCPSRVVLCPKKCLAADGKRFQCLLKDLDVHLDNDCSYRIAECQHCNQQGTFKDINEAHLENCPFVLAACPSCGCEVELSSSLLLFHLLTDCEHAPIACRYSDLGCNIVLLRSDMKKHEQDHSLHFHVLTDAVSKFQLQMDTAHKEILSLREDLATKEDSKLDSALHAVTFKLPLFSSYAQKDSFTFDQLFSDANKKGYRFSMKILPHNDGHLSVYFFLMRGSSDESLRWPFRGSIRVELLNQAKDGGHYCKLVEFRRSHGQRVTEREASSQGFGLPHFVQLEKLRRKNGHGRNKTQYLADDSLFFRITVMPHNQKHWLKCTH